MRTISAREAQRLPPPAFGPAISIYLVASVTGRSAPMLSRRALSDLFASAERMIESCCDSDAAMRIVRPLEHMLTHWRPRKNSKGFAIFHSTSLTRVVELPVSVPDRIVIADSFHIKPLLRCMQMRPDFLLLVLSDQVSCLYSTSIDGTAKVASVPTEQRSASDFYGHRASQSWYLEEFIAIRHDMGLQAMRGLNRYLHPFWRDDSRPLILAGPQHLQVAFRRACTNVNLLPRGISGYVADLSESQLADMAGSIVGERCEVYDSQATANYCLAEEGGHGTSDLSAIGRAAASGEVANLLIATDTDIWGAYDRINGNISVLESRAQRMVCDDVLDDIAEVVLSKGGVVRAMPLAVMPEKNPIAAVLSTAGNFS